MDIRVDSIEAKLMTFKENTKKDYDSVNANISALSKKIDNRNDYIEVAVTEKMQATAKSMEAYVSGLNKEMGIRVDSIDNSISLLNNKTNDMEDSIQECSGAEAICGYQDHVLCHLWDHNF